ncbi:hypothetical protein KC332_g3 [Hortaea werneckii]|nr:hypothetical protein KC348_g5 [Hortaea werneckii]KAI7421921.1 hypothetical protein KC332_g3 [Hortaea werneckii]
MSGNARGDDQVAKSLLLEDLAGELGTVEDAIDCTDEHTVDSVLFLVFLDSLLSDRLGNGHAGIRNKDLRGQIPQLGTYNLSQQMVSSRLDNMHLRFSSDAMLLRKSVTFSDSCIIAPVPEGQIASSFGDGFGCSETNAIRGSRDGNHLALHTQLLKHIVWSVWGWLRIPGDRRFVKGHRHDEWMMRIEWNELQTPSYVIVLMCWVVGAQSPDTTLHFPHTSNVQLALSQWEKLPYIP